MNIELRKAISTVQITLHNVADQLDNNGEHDDAKSIDDAWALIQATINNLVNPSESTPQNEYSSGSANPGSNPKQPRKVQS